MHQPDVLDSQILLVDDDPGAIKVMRGLLTQFRHLSFARSGSDALRQIRAVKPDLVIVDVNMPGMSGLQLCDQLQADPELKNLPVIVATAEKLTTLESTALQQGAVDFVTKPLVPETFVARVQSHLRAKALAQEMRSQLLASPERLLPEGRTARLLVVDDDVAALTLMRQTLAELGALHFATTGLDALRVAHDLRPDLVLLDINMPGVDGFSVCTSLKSQQEFRHVPVVFVTRYDDPDRERRALEMGAADFISKPIDPSVLRARVRNLLALKVRMDAELRALSDHWRKLADSRVAELVMAASDGVLSCDAGGHVLLANNAAVVMLEHVGPHPVGLKLEQLLPGIEEVLELATQAPVRLKLPGPDASARPVEIRASRSENGELTTLVIRDVLEREQLEAEQRARAMAEAAALAKSRLLSYVNHEMGAPLNAVLGFSQLMKLDEQHPMAEVQRARLDRIVEGAMQAQFLLTDLMDLSRHEAGKLSVDLKPVDAVARVQEVIAALAPAAQSAAVKVTFSAPDAAPAVMADARRLSQCLTNLLSNAIKYGRKNGLVSIGLSTSGNEVRIDVRDDGIGMTEAQLSRLFEPFNRLGQEGSERSGTGLGLVITKSLVEAMQGRLIVDSVTEQGSCFSLVLPSVAALSDATR